jgi:hypothetical protein
VYLHMERRLDLPERHSQGGPPKVERVQGCRAGGSRVTHNAGPLGRGATHFRPVAFAVRLASKC